MAQTAAFTATPLTKLPEHQLAQERDYLNRHCGDLAKRMEELRQLAPKAESQFAWRINEDYAIASERYMRIVEELERRHIP